MLMTSICLESIYKLLEENAEILLKPSKNIGLDLKSVKAKYMTTSHLQNVEQNQNILIRNLSFENVEKFRCLGVMVRISDDFSEGIKHRINNGNACYC